MLSKRKKFITAIVIFGVLIISVAYVMLASAPQPTPTIIPSDLQSPQLVIPESPLGVIGMFMATITALGLYTIVKKKHAA